MDPEQLLLHKWRNLTTDKQQEVLDFLEFIHQKSISKKPTQPPDSQTIAQRVKRWKDWAESHPKNSPGLPDQALSRDSIYE